MKKIGLLLALVAFVSMTTFCGKADVNEKISNFVKTYFPQTEIVSNMIDGNEHDVVLSDGTKIEFDRNGEWKDIDCSKSNSYTSVPDAIVPEQIKAHITANYPNNIIVELTKDGKKWDVELNNGLELEFDKNFKLLKID